MAVKAGNPDTSSHVCGAVTRWVTKISLSLTLSPVYLSPSGKAPNTQLGLGPAEVGGLTSLPPSSALSSASNQPDVGSHSCASSPAGFVRAPPLRLLYFFLSSRHLLPQHLHQKAGSTDRKLAVPSECPSAVFCICFVFMSLCGSCLFVCFSS